MNKRKQKKKLKSLESGKFEQSTSSDESTQFIHKSKSVYKLVQKEQFEDTKGHACEVRSLIISNFDQNEHAYNNEDSKIMTDEEADKTTNDIDDTPAPPRLPSCHHPACIKKQ